MGSGVPLLNEYKQDFFFKRFPQTVLGGPKIKLGYNAPVCVYLGQILVFLLPWIIAGMFTVFVEVGLFKAEIASYIFGASMVLFVSLIQFISILVQSNKSEKVITTKKQSMLAEEDELEFMSCCSPQTLEFIIPIKKYKINIFLHAVISGLMCGTGFLYLLPLTTLNKLFSDTVVIVLIFIFGWLAMCIAQYSLSVCSPPEPATFRTMDCYELSYLMRPFYVCLCITVDVVSRFNPEWDLTIANQAVHVVLACLPVLWTLGLLPPLDAFFLWLAEQVHVFLLGGSPMASDIRLIIMLLFSIVVFLLVFYLPAILWSLVVAAALGYILSLDLGGLGCQIHQNLAKRNRILSNEDKLLLYEDKLIWTWGIKEVLYHICMTLCIAVEAGLLYYHASMLGELAWYALGYITIGFCIVEKITRDIQGVYVLCGLWRNPLYPHSLHRKAAYHQRKNILKAFGFLRRCIIKCAAPLVLVAYLAVCASYAPTEPMAQMVNNSHFMWYPIGIMRGFRWVWQSTGHALLEVSIAHVLILIYPGVWIFEIWSIPILLLVISVGRDRLYQLCNKVYFFLTVLVTAWTDKKQRRHSTAIVIFLSFIFSPFLLALIAATAAFSAPLLPLFTLPVIFWGFPRPLRFWPELVGGSANKCPDTVYYKQFAVQFARSLHGVFNSGSLGEPCPGNQYLARFQDRLAWIVVLEQGSSYCCVSVKGLELQETTCHTVEATQIDTQFEMTFEKSDKWEFCSFNQYPFHTLTPADAFPVRTYSDARSILIGVIDSLDSLQLAKAYFVKSLIWLLVHHVYKTKQQNKDSIQFLVSEKTEQKDGVNFSTLGKSEHRQSLTEKNLVTEKTVEPDTYMNATGSGPPSLSRPSTADSSAQRRKLSWASSIVSFTDSIWSDERDPFTMDGKKKPPMTVMKKDQISPITIVVQPRPKKNIVEESEDDDLFDEQALGLPATDICRSKVSPQPMSCFSKSPQKKATSVSNSIYRPLTSLAGSPDFKCIYSSQLSLPAKWRELPIEPIQLNKLQDSFPWEWYNYVLGKLDWSATNRPTAQVVSEVRADDLLANSYAQLTMACSSAFESHGVHSFANYLYKYYIGDIPWNAMWDWLSENKDLQNIVQKAFRYGFKLMIDEILVSEISSHEELQEYLEDFEYSWYIGLETDPEWNLSIIASKPHLFSLGHNTSQGTYSSRVLTLQDIMVHMGRLNPEVVRGQWANLSLELLYFTNDDEERYSIQAHPTILRNLTVQAADPPLGYPVFASEPMSISTL